MARTKREDYPRDEPEDFAERFLNWLGQRKINSYDDMKRLIKEYLKGASAEIMTTADFDAVYETSRIKNKILNDVENELKRTYPSLTNKEIEAKSKAVYSERERIKQEVLREARDFELPKLISISYKRKGKQIVYVRAKPIRWSKVEEQYLKTRSNVKNKELVSQFNAHFRSRQRNYASIASKRRRIA